MKRVDGRAQHEVRKISIEADQFGYSDGSVLISLGNTKVVASVTLQSGVPLFLKGKGTGWLTAEYAMLPTATIQRTMRESLAIQRNGRSIEISRLIGRVLRTIVSCDLLGEKTIYIDCDVLQADGSTRVAAIIAASLALKRAENRWLNQRKIKVPIVQDLLVAVSAGIISDGQLCIDLNQVEDNQAVADFNFVLTSQLEIVEIQGTAEKKPLPAETFDRMKEEAYRAASGILQQMKHVIIHDNLLTRVDKKTDTLAALEEKKMKQKAGLFSLENRFVRSMS